MKNKHEVEFRALITSEVYNKLLDRGRRENSESFHGPLSIQDNYFCPLHVKNFSEVEMNDVGSYSLRLRREIKDNKTTVTLNTKIIRNVGDHNAWLEHETGLTSYEEGKMILEAIGFKSFFEFKKNRYSFQDANIHVCLEDIENFQPAIEIEIMTTEDKVQEAKDALIQYMESNNISKENLVKKSITNILMRERASF
jgi:predicted adenylyl cyclase CyaB